MMSDCTGVSSAIRASAELGRLGIAIRANRYDQGASELVNANTSATATAAISTSLPGSSTATISAMTTTRAMMPTARKPKVFTRAPRPITAAASSTHAAAVSTVIASPWSSRK